MNTALSSFPALYRHWLEELLPHGIPQETYATCANCVMCEKTGDFHSGKWSFDEKVKCCSYYPDLPNYMVGLCLLSEEPEVSHGQSALLRSIQNGTGVSPLFVGMTALYRLQYNSAGPMVFGRSSALSCPYLVGDGRCSVWSFRNATCATYFCKHVRGKVGQQFWDALKDFLRIIEEEMAISVALELGCPATSVIDAGESRQKVEMALARELVAIERRMPSRGRFGTWSGREVEFFRACGKVVERLRLSDVLARCGPHAQTRLVILKTAYSALLSESIPERLVLAVLQTRLLSADRIQIATYSFANPIMVSRAVFDVLHHFDGSKSTDEVIRSLREEARIEISPSLVRKLVEHGVLVSEWDKPAEFHGSQTAV